MLYVVKNQQNEMIGFSEDLEFVFTYLSQFYKSHSGEKISLDITKIENQKEEIDIAIQFEEYQLIELFPGIVVTLWEYPIHDEFFRDFYESGKNVLVKTAAHHLRSHGKEVNDTTIDEYLRKSFKSKYYAMISYDNFIGSLSKEQIYNLMGSSELNKYLYAMNCEYNRKINVDN